MSTKSALDKKKEKLAELEAKKKKLDLEARKLWAWFMLTDTLSIHQAASLSKS